MVGDDPLPAAALGTQKIAHGGTRRVVGSSHSPMNCTMPRRPWPPSSTTTAPSFGQSGSWRWETGRCHLTEPASGCPYTSAPAATLPVGRRRGRPLPRPRTLGCPGRKSRLVVIRQAAVVSRAVLSERCPGRSPTRAPGSRLYSMNWKVHAWRWLLTSSGLRAMRGGKIRSRLRSRASSRPSTGPPGTTTWKVCGCALW